jgi:hypothetical protein
MASTEQILVCRDRWLGALASGSVAALAHATFEACRESVAQLGSQLAGLGYPLQTFLRPCPADLFERIEQVESHTGVRLPEVIPEFWRIVGGIGLVDLRHYTHVAFWEGLGITPAHGFSDGVYVDACDDDWLTYTVEDFDNYADDHDEQSFMYTLAPDGYHKDDISGGPPYAIGRGSDWAPTWENFHWAGHRRPETATADPPDFVSYLRTAILECAGFPGFFGDREFEAIRRNLVRDLQPF